jgi:hypothetical protein
MSQSREQPIEPVSLSRLQQAPAIKSSGRFPGVWSRRLISAERDGYFVYERLQATSRWAINTVPGILSRQKSPFRFRAESLSSF